MQNVDFQNMKNRCEWCGTDPLYVKYHDEEWGVPLHDDNGLFEFLILEGAQAGLSWLTILRKRDNYRNAFHGFDPQKIARYSETDVRRLLADPGIVRNRLKIESTVRNARGVLAIREEFASLDSFIWRYVDFQPRQNAWRSQADRGARRNCSDCESGLNTRIEGEPTRSNFQWHCVERRDGRNYGRDPSRLSGQRNGNRREAAWQIRGRGGAGNSSRLDHRGRR